MISLAYELFKYIVLIFLLLMFMLIPLCLENNALYISTDNVSHV